MKRLPETPRPATVKILSRQPSYIMTAHNLRRQAVSQGAQAFGFELVYPPMTRAEFGPIFGHLLEHEGRAGTFEYAPHTLAAPIGAGTAGAQTATENMVKWSQRFDLAPWYATQYGGTSQTTPAPDGSDAQLCGFDREQESDWAKWSQDLGVLSGQVVASCYVKQGTADRVDLYLVDLDTETTSIVRCPWTAGVPDGVSPSNADAYGADDVGDGWYRLWVSRDLPTNNQDGHSFALRIYPRVYQGGIEAGTYLWGAQVAAGSLAPMDYLKTWSVTRTAEPGPVLTFTQNQVAFSWDFMQSEWVKTCCNEPATGPEFKGHAVAPDGSEAQSWGTPTDNGVYGGCMVYTLPVATTTQYVASLYIKRDTADRVGLNLYDSTAGMSHKVDVMFDAGGACSIYSSYDNDGTGLEAVGDGWYRLWVVVDAANRGISGNALKLYIYPHAEDDGDPRQPEGTYLWGAQVETAGTLPGLHLSRHGAGTDAYVYPGGFDIPTAGWAPSVAGVLRAGDFVRFSVLDKVFTVTTDVDSDALGNGVLRVSPAVPVSVLWPGPSIQVENMVFNVASGSDVVEAPTDRNGFYTYTLALVEVL